jgi:hypothetical protein
MTSMIQNIVKQTAIGMSLEDMLTKGDTFQQVV